MKKHGVGGANTRTGLKFEGKVDFLTFIKKQKKIVLRVVTFFTKVKRSA